MTVSVLDRTYEQRLASIEKANSVRSARAALKRNVCAGRVDLAAVITDPAPELLSMKVAVLLCAQAKWGPFRVGRLMRALQISDHKTLGGLSGRQRGELVKCLRPEVFDRPARAHLESGSLAGQKGTS